VYGGVRGSAFALDGVAALGVDGDLAFGFLLDKFAGWVGAAVLPGDCGERVLVDGVFAITRSQGRCGKGIGASKERYGRDGMRGPERE